MKFETEHIMSLIAHKSIELVNIRFEGNGGTLFIDYGTGKIEMYNTNLELVGKSQAFTVADFNANLHDLKEAMEIVI